MAELLVFVADTPQRADRYQDGDVVCAFDSNRIHCVHAQHVCKPTTFNTHGLRETGGLAQEYLERTYQFKMERVSTHEVRRTNLITLESEILSNVPNANGHAVHVVELLARRLKHAKHLFFGTPGNEIWYGGRSDLSDAAINPVWDRIEADTPLRKADHGRWPLTPMEKHKFLPLPSQDFTTQTRANIMSAEFDYDSNQPEWSDVPKEAGDNITNKRRTHISNWRDLVPNVADVLNESVEVDLRDSVADVLVSEFGVKPRVNVWSNREWLTDGVFLEARP
jgi:hypothetical protein